MATLAFWAFVFLIFICLSQERKLEEKEEVCKPVLHEQQEEAGFYPRKSSDL
jgi:hypothetical protein